MAQGIYELIWLRMLMRGLRLLSKDPMKLYYDNKVTINIAHNPVQHNRTKHIEINRHFIKEKLNEGIISMPFVKSTEQLTVSLLKEFKIECLILL